MKGDSLNTFSNRFLYALGTKEMVSQGVCFVCVCVVIYSPPDPDRHFYVFPALIPEDSLWNSEEWNGT